MGDPMRTLCCLTVAVLTTAVPASAATTYVTGFDKTSNIYTNLMQQYPNTGPGTPGSRTGTANASYLFTPQATGEGHPENVNYADNGISYLLTSDAAGRDFAEVGTADFGVASLTLPIGVANASTLYLLAGAYNGSSFNITLNATGGVSRTFSDIALPDFNGGAINSVSGDVADQTVFRVYGQGAGGTGNSSNGAYNNYSLTQVGFTLGDAFKGRTLTSATITGNGYETLILGATVVSPDVSAVPEPAGWAMMIGGFGIVGGSLRRRPRPTVTFG